MYSELAVFQKNSTNIKHSEGNSYYDFNTCWAARSRSSRSGSGIFTRIIFDISAQMVAPLSIALNYEKLKYVNHGSSYIL